MNDIKGRDLCISKQKSVDADIFIDLRRMRGYKPKVTKAYTRIKRQEKQQ